MAQAPRIQPFDVGGHYQNIGKAAGDLATKPVEGYFRGKEVGAKAQQAGLKAEKTQFELEDYARKLEEAGSSKKALDEVKDTTVRLLLGDEGYFAITGSKKSPQAFEKSEKGGREQFGPGFKIAEEEKGEFVPTGPDTEKMVETGGVLKDDIPYEQSLLIVRDINNAKSAKEIKAIMGAVGRYVETQRGMRGKYPGIKLDSFKADQVQTKEDKQGNVSAAYGDDYSKRAQEIAKPAFLQEAMKTDIQAYVKEELAKSEPNPNENEALQAVLKGKHGSEISADANLRGAVKDMFLGELDREKLEISKLEQQRKGRETVSKGIKFANSNELSAIDDARVAKNPSNKVQRSVDAKLWERVRQQKPFGEAEAQELFNNLKAEEKKEGEPLLKRSSADLIMERTGGDFSKPSYESEVEQNGGNFPGLKNHGEFLQTIDKTVPAPKKGGLEKVVDKVKSVLGGDEPAAGGMQSFNSAAEVRAANLKKGTVVLVNGSKVTVD